MVAANRSNYPVISVHPDELSSKMGDWTSRSGPLYARLADAIADCVSHGLLAAERLPAERELADHLGVSRGTVIGAYDALRARGLARSRRGSGTFLTASESSSRTHEAPLLSKLVEPDQAPINFSMAALQTPELLGDLRVSLHDALDHFPRHGYAPLGAALLRAAIAEHLSGGPAGPTEPRQVLVTNGGQGAISLLAAAMIKPGDRVLVEAPTYPGAIEIFSRAGARVEALERDHAGILREALEQALDAGPARLLYLVPTCQNPTGKTMSEGRRRKVLRIARERRTVIVEDTAMADLGRRPAPPHMCALSPEDVITIGSLSKCYWAGLRIGWIRAAPELIQRLGRLRASLDLGAPLLDQVAAAEIYRDFDRAIEPVRNAARDRLALLVQELRAQLPDWEFEEPEGGWSVWIRLPHGEGERFAQAALRNGVAIATGAAMAPDDRFASHVRLSAGGPPDEIVNGVALLARAWQRMIAQPDRSGEAITLPV